MSAVKTLSDYLALVTSEHQGKRLFTAYLTALLQPYIDAQASLRNLLTAFDVDTAVGVQLDAVGQWVGRSRFVQTPLAGVYFSFDLLGLGFDQGQWLGPFDPLDGLTRLDDASYRQLLKAKIILNNWDGSIPVAASAVSEMLSGSPGSVVTILDNQDMTMTVGISGQVPPAVTLSLLQGGYLPVNPEGVGVNYAITSVNSSPLFGFDVSNNAIAGLDSGAWSGAPGVGPGQVTGFSLVSFTDTTAAFSWLAPATGTGPYTYQLQMQVGDGTQGIWTLSGQPVSITQASVSGLSPGTQYAFEVYAVNPTGPGLPSIPIVFSTNASGFFIAANGRAAIPSLSAAGATTVTAQFILASGSALLPTPTSLARAIQPNAAAGVATVPSITAAATFGNLAPVLASATVAISLTAFGSLSLQGLDFVAGAVAIPLLAAATMTSQRSMAGRAAIPSLSAVGTIATSSGNAIVVNQPTGATSGTPFTVTGQLNGYAATPTLFYSIDPSLPPVSGVTESETTTSIQLNWAADAAVSLTNVPAGSVTRTQFSFTAPGLSAGSHTILVTDGVIVGSLTINVPQSFVGIVSNIHTGLNTWTSHTFALGERTGNAGQAYQCITAGTSTGAPTGQGGSINNGGAAVFKWLSLIDYTSAQAWLNNYLGTTLTQPVVGLLWNDGPITTTANTRFLNDFPALVGTSATNTITLTCAPGESFRDATTSPLFFNSANGVSFVNTAIMNVELFSLNSPYWIIDGIQVQDQNAASQAIVFHVAANNCTLRNCIVDGYSQATNSKEMVYIQNNFTGFLADNCLLYDRKAASDFIHTLKFDLGATGRCANLTVYAANTNTALSGGLTTLTSSTGAMVVTNCAVFNYGTNPVLSQNFAGAATVSYSATDSAAWDNLGTTDAGHNLFSRTIANQFNSVTSDFRLKAGSDCINAGTTDVADVPTADDIYRKPRPDGAAWDIGAYES